MPWIWSTVQGAYVWARNPSQANREQNNRNSRNNLHDELQRLRQNEIGSAERQGELRSELHQQFALNRAWCERHEATEAAQRSLEARVKETQMEFLSEKAVAQARQEEAETEAAKASVACRVQQEEAALRTARTEAAAAEEELQLQKRSFSEMQERLQREEVAALKAEDQKRRRQEDGLHQELRRYLESDAQLRQELAAREVAMHAAEESAASSHQMLCAYEDEIEQQLQGYKAVASSPNRDVEMPAADDNEKAESADDNEKKEEESCSEMEPTEGAEGSEEEPEEGASSADEKGSEGSEESAKDDDDDRATEGSEEEEGEDDSAAGSDEEAQDSSEPEQHSSEEECDEDSDDAGSSEEPEPVKSVMKVSKDASPKPKQNDERKKEKESRKDKGKDKRGREEDKDEKAGSHKALHKAESKLAVNSNSHHTELQDMGSELENNVWKHYKAWCRKTKVAGCGHRFNLTRFGREQWGSYPELQSCYKAYTVKMMIYWVYAFLCDENHNVPNGGNRLKLSYALAKMQWLFDRSGSFLSTAVKDEAVHLGKSFLLLYQSMAVENIQQHKKNWKIVPKFHSFLHLLL
ncbi:hypothetical protein AK812_SmicGene42495 [Symbiodinium microadriaticum]|uniref:Uncharacterized protein n=1 Tax=Symbiodinium microadriaticum TaxID=2951 RepID=A0A1Q9C3E1_SYMMI|nr:hypothetical protein AK812_SmicGene42495 [Symbiodinium microadriaticum]